MEVVLNVFFIYVKIVIFTTDTHVLYSRSQRGWSPGIRLVWSVIDSEVSVFLNTDGRRIKGGNAVENVRCYWANWKFPEQLYFNRFSRIPGGPVKG